MDFAVVDGFRLAYRQHGSGETVLLIHGVTTASFIWDRVVPHLSPLYRTVAVDLLGCGASDRPLGVDCSLRRQAELLGGLVETAGFGPVHLVGHDVGGGIAQILSVRRPDLVRDLALLNTVGYDFWPVQPIVTLRTPIVRQLAMATLDLGILRIIVRRALFHPERLTDELLGNVRREVSAESARRSFLQFVRALNNRDLTEIADDLRKVAIPVLVVRGDADAYLSAEIAERLHREIPSSRLLRIATAGHYIQEDEPAAVAEALLGHFRAAAP